MASGSAEDVLPEFHRGVLRDVENVKSELDRLVEKARDNPLTPDFLIC